MSYTVYIAVNIWNGKRYIGVTGKGMAHRSKNHWKKACAGGRECPRFYDALRKHGPESFAWKELFICEDRSEAYRKEFELVRDLGPEYNSMDGGFGAPPSVGWNKRPVLCLEDGVEHESATIAAAHYGVDFSEVCKALRGEVRCVKGLHFCYSPAPADTTLEEIIKAIDVAFVKKRRRVASRKEAVGRPGVKDGRDAKGRSAAGPMSGARKVMCVDDGKIFDSLSDAARYYDVDTGALSQVCSGKRFRRTVGGKSFRYAEASH